VALVAALTHPALRALVLGVLLQLAAIAGAHATIVLGSLTLSPDPPIPGQSIEIRLEMVDPTQFPIEDAIVTIELTPAGGGRTVTGAFTEVEPGVYRSGVTLAAAGEYEVLMRDRTFRQEEARVELPLTVGDEQLEAIRFVFPPTAIGPNRSITTWLLWLIGLPVVAGIVVTALVLTGGRKSDQNADDSPG
jgi:hypothetical protein